MVANAIYLQSTKTYCLVVTWDDHANSSKNPTSMIYDLNVIVKVCPLSKRGQAASFAALLALPNFDLIAGTQIVQEIFPPWFLL